MARAMRFNDARRHWLGDGGVPVPNAQAQGRSNGCIKCPMNKKMGVYEGLTKAAARLVAFQIEIKNEMKLHVEGEDKLHICDACGCVIELKIHQPINVIQETTDESKLHPDCWILKELGM